jgi:flagellar basal body-associated protein FliL
MKKLLMIVAILGVVTISGSVFYYYVLFLPKQTAKTQENMDAMRKAVAPTPKEAREYMKAWGF